MEVKETKHCTAFQGTRRVASGNLPEVAKIVKETITRNSQPTVLIFDDVTGEVVEVDFRGTLKDVLKRLQHPTSTDGSAAGNPETDSSPPKRGPGRPKLGVVSREVTLLPRHWEWLNCQPGGASVALRKLVEQARRAYRDRDRARHSQEAAYRFMVAMAGDLPGFEEATRALFSGNHDRFRDMTGSWPADIQSHAHKLAEAAFQPSMGAQA